VMEPNRQCLLDPPVKPGDDSLGVGRAALPMPLPTAV
jgi:hypothetical protein